MPNRRCGLRNQSTSTPSSATRFSTPLAPMIDVFTAPDRISAPTITTKTWKPSRSSCGPARFIARPPIRLSYVVLPDAVGDDHHGEQRDQPGRDHRVGADDVGRDLQILQLGRGDLAVDLRQRLEAAHGQQRVAEGDHHRHERNLRPEGALEPAQRLVGEAADWKATEPAASSTLSFSSSVIGHQISSITTITVVTCMMRSALPLDS